MSEPDRLDYANPDLINPQDNSGRATTASILMMVYAGFSVLSGIVQALPLLAGRTNEIDLANPQTGLAAGAGAAVFGCIGTIIAILTIVFYCMWQYRATWNLRAIGRETVFGPGWGVAGIVIPFVNLVMAPMMLFSLWRVSGRAEKGGSLFGSPMSIVVLFVAAIVLAIIAGVLVASETYFLAGLVSVLGTLCGAAALFAWAFFVKEVQSGGDQA